ncbi:MAG: 50S ribosomal protein L3 [Eubacteriales bacterium]|jgi:large subunit ribosomal protein L3|nr:50S ribosomal protein L3 [Faecalibacterium sp.]MDD7570957.1 50S ribosomal protein L3 [Faecalibacterium sp.]MDY6150953.1 50S ribosomal protein L3 [Eubacteriales bacterium]CCY04876.1 50S ribosomal protein L3 [Faecalibacterium sp. CAG:1138]
MNKAIIGKKLGMSQIFAPDGKVIPVTVVEAGPCAVVQIKTVENDGYEAIKVAYGVVKERNVSKPMAGQFKKAGVAAKRYLRELKLNVADYTVGQEIKCNIFSEGDHVDVQGTTRGRGFTGVIQRWNAQRVGSMSHGTGPIHRSVGSMAANSDPSRVFKNKHMAGQYGHETVTIQNLVVARVDEARNLLLIKGGIPGPKGSLVIVKESIKG